MSDLFVDAGKVLAFASSDTKAGKMWRMEVEDLDTGDCDWFGLGKEKPDFGEGSEVSFEFKENGKFLNVFEESIEVLNLVEPKQRGGRNGGSRNGGGSRGGRGGDSGSSRGGSSRSSGSRGGSSRSRGGDDKGGSSRSNGGGSRSKGKGSDKGGKQETDWEMKDKKIGLLAMRNSAIEVVKIAVEAGALKLGTKQGEKYDILLGLVDDLTVRFHEQEQAYCESEYDLSTIAEVGEDGEEDE